MKCVNMLNIRLLSKASFISPVLIIALEQKVVIVPQSLLYICLFKFSVLLRKLGKI